MQVLNMKDFRLDVNTEKYSSSILQESTAFLNS